MSFERDVAMAVALAVKSQTAPLLERLAVAEARLADIDKYAARVEGYTSFLQRDAAALSERVAVVESRTYAPGPLGEPGPPGPSGPPGERGIDGKDGALGSIGSSGPQGERGVPGVQGERGPAGERGMDGKDGAPGLNGKDGAPGIDGKDGANGLNGKDGASGDRGLQGEKGLDGVAGRDGRDGVAGAHGLPGEKGLDGAPGAPGRDGLNGKDGTLEQLKIVRDDERTARFCFKDGTPIEGGDIPSYSVIDRGVYQAGKTYDDGDATTWDGHYWIAQQQTSDQPGEGSPSWRLAVRRGKQGREGKQGKDGSPGRDLTQMDPATGRKW